MVVLDADSIMSGEAIAKLVRLMERNGGGRVDPSEVPALANAETILARLQQFASSIYGPVAGRRPQFLAVKRSELQVNAIIRRDPFIRHCSLPELPGDGPFGGRIASHDYVEAALMRRAGWQVWLATEMEGNYEECPSSVIDLAKRDRRWLQGNLQHSRLIVARGFHSGQPGPFYSGYPLLPRLAPLARPAHNLGRHRLAQFDTSECIGATPISGFAQHLHWSLQDAGAFAVWLYPICSSFCRRSSRCLSCSSRPADVTAFGG